MKKPIWPDYSFMGKKYGLERILKFLKEMGNPQEEIPPVFHVAGTNGKGSTTAFLKFILESMDYKVHRYTSPHLVEFNERIEVSSEIISDKYLNELSLECKRVSEEKGLEISFFEATTVMAFWAFNRNEARATILEVGLGGRLDATNVIKKPLVSIITSISFDHMKILGDTLEKIAIEKAGIMKKGCPVVINKQTEGVSQVLRKIAKERGCEVYEYGREWSVRAIEGGFVFEGFGKVWELPLPALVGEHQLENVGGAIASLLCQNEVLVSKEAIEQGIKNVKWKARLQNLTNTNLGRMLPKGSELWLDGAHNEDGARQVVRWLRECNKKDKKRTVVILGMLARKDPKGFLKVLKGNMDLLITTNIEDEPKCVEAGEFARLAKEVGIEAVAKESFEEGIKSEVSNQKSVIRKGRITNASRQGRECGEGATSPFPAIASPFPAVRVLICGSLYLAGTVLEKVKNE